MPLFLQSWVQQPDQKEKKKKQQIYGFILKPFLVKDLPGTKVVPTLHVLLAPGLPLSQYLLHCPVTKPPAPLLEDQLSKTDIPYLRWVGFPQKQTLRQGFGCKELVQKPIFSRRHPWGNGDRTQGKRRRYTDKQGDTVGNSGLLPLGILEASEGYAPEGYHVMGEKVRVVIYLHLGTAQPCHPWAQLLQHPEPAHSPSITGACSRTPSPMARVRATMDGTSGAPCSPLLVSKALNPAPQPANAWSRAYEME